MPVVWFIARRYLAAHWRRGFLSFIGAFAITGITLGTASLIITLSVLDGFEREIRTKVIDFTSHIQILGFRDQRLPGDGSVEERIRKPVNGVQSVNPFVAREGMIRFHDQTDGIYLKAIAPETRVPGASMHIVEGRFLAHSKKGVSELVLGCTLAEKLGVSVGDKVVVFGLPWGSGSFSSLRALPTVVVGLYQSGMSEYDDIYVYTDLGSAQRLFQIGSDVLGFDVMVDNIDSIDTIAQTIQEQLGYPFFVRTVFQQYRNLFSWVELQRQMSPILLALIMIVATINIIGTLLMVVLDKTSSIAILISMGATRVTVRRLFLVLGMFMAGIGIVLGNLLAFLLCELERSCGFFSIPSDIYYMSSVPIEINPLNFLAVSAVTFLLCLLTSIVPAHAAARLKPVDVLRFG